jgi:hypothetical protein
MVKRQVTKLIVSQAFQRSERKTGGSFIKGRDRARYARKTSIYEGR